MRSVFAAVMGVLASLVMMSMHVYAEGKKPETNEERTKRCP